MATLYDRDMHQSRNFNGQLHVASSNASKQSLKLFKAMKPILIFGQIFGLLPVSLNNDVEKIQFKFKSFKTFYSFLLQFFCISEFVALAYFLYADDNFDFNVLGNLIFYFIGIFTTFYFIFFANKWKSLIVLWDKYDDVFSCPLYSHSHETIVFGRKVKFISAFFFGFLIIDNFFRMSSEIYIGYLKFERCSNDDDADFSPIAKEIYIQQRSILFRLIDFNYFYIPIFEFVHISRRVHWCFVELFIIILGMNLSLKFNQFYERLNKVRQQIVWDGYWRMSREHYVMLCELSEKASEFSSPLLTLITFADFFFLCERLYKQYAADYDTFGRIQISLLGTFFLLRSIILFYYCSTVNFHASRPLEILRDAPLRNINVDFQRLVNEVENCDRGFSGAGFFIIKKSFIISFIGAVTTYQLVILQNINTIRRAINSTVIDC
ncbi:hypothetical protein PVAND_009305 [Polypedilum vanderplanki]|uniref:Gustatory receptor n=1 Tax=Polypedilum vanderplanki TaxID=319348 RepID=A0A9J6CCW5_POLVA|nr:hypothetical protein PVAND_009305 [Polypedilum vanderplanki]